MPSRIRTVTRENPANRDELAALKARLRETEDLLSAIRAGEVDAIAVDTSAGERLFTLEGADKPYRVMVETMSEAAITVTEDGIILYCNQRFADMTKTDLHKIIGTSLLAHCAPEDTRKIVAAFQESDTREPRLRTTLLSGDASLVPVNMAMHGQSARERHCIVIVISDLTQWQEAEEARIRAIRALRITNACSDVIIHAADEPAMLIDICQAMVDVGGYRFAWITYACADPAKPPVRVCRAAWSGACDKINGTSTKVETEHIAAQERASIDLAIHSGSAVITRDTDIQPDTGSWLRLTPDKGYRACVSVPLRSDDRVLGALSICSDDPDAFNPDDVELLTTLANDMAFGIVAQRNKSAQSRLAAVVESSGDAIVTRDLNGMITTWNKAAERLFGYRADEIIGRPLAILCPRELTGESAWLFEKIRRDEAVEQFDSIRVTKEGQRLHVSLTFSPIRDDAGEIVAASVFMRDSTARRNAEEALRFRESVLRVETDKLHSILHSMAEAIVVADKDGTIVEANPAACALYGIDGLAGTVADWAIQCCLYRSDQSAPLSFEQNPLVRAMRGQDTNDLELYIKPSGGVGVHIDLTGRSIRAADGSVSGGLIVFADITQRKQTEAELREHRRHLEQLVAARTEDLAKANVTNAELERVGQQLEHARRASEQANNAKSRFLTSITHELRTPLHGILGYAELLGLEGGLNPVQAEHVAAMTAAGEHLLRLINTVLDVSQIEADRLELHPVDIELSDLAGTCLNVVRLAAETKGLALVLTAAGPLHIRADVTRLRQVLLNLLGNAVKFTVSGSVELRIGPTETGEFARLEVADTGPGIWARHRDKLFQKFERLNADAVAGIEGAGLGLALSERLVRAMGGRIGYEDNPGGGSIFWLELPVGETDAAVQEAAAKSSRTAKPGLRVMVVDDDALNRDIANRFLTLAGHKVVCLDNGAAAVDAASSTDFDVILMDVRMPGMNGLEATRRIRALPAPGCTVPVIALTAQAFAKQIEICLKAGMNTHVSKPFRQEVLLAAVENAASAAGAPAAMPLANISAGGEPESPVFDRAMFEDTTGCLSPGDVGEHLRTMIARGEAMILELPASKIPARARDLAAAAHKLAGSAAMLGFASLAQVGRRFEFAADSGSSETVALADQLAAAVGRALAILREELAGIAVPA